MGPVTAKYEECFEAVAQIMSERTKCTVTVDDIRQDVCRPTTSIYSAVVPNNANGVSEGNNICIVCLVRKWKSPHEFVVTTS